MLFPRPSYLVRKGGFQKILVKGVFICTMAFLFGGFTPFAFTGRLFYFSFKGFRISTLGDVLQWVFICCTGGECVAVGIHFFFV